MKISFLLVALAFTAAAEAQTEDFQKLLRLYGHGRVEMDSTIARKYFGVLPSDLAHEAYTDTILIIKPQFVAISCYLPCVAGGMCEASILATFKPNGVPVDQIGYEHYYADCSFADIRSCIFSSDTLIIFSNEDTETDCDSDSTTSIKLTLSFVFVSDSGEFSDQALRVDTRRKYYSASSSFLDEKSLLATSREELSAIRNEIFAAHGYIFRSKKWLDYFSQFAWYKPEFENVDDQLTIIERKNIELIKRLEQN